MVLCSKAQSPVVYSANHKWGYTINNSVAIKAQYDTAFAFDKSGSIAMVGNKNLLRTVINPLTGEETTTIDYYFITKNNTRIKLKNESQADSISAFPDQQELKLNYINDLNVFEIVFNNKVWLFHKNGKQLSAGFDDIFQSELNRFYVTEIYTEWDQEIVRSKGLIDTSGKTIIKCEKKHIHFNVEDSIIYCCSAIFNKKLSDEVLDYKGNMLYENKNHIEFASARAYVYKLYEPEEVFMIESPAKKDLYGMQGESFYYLKQNKALVVNKDVWTLVNLQTGKKQKVNKDAFYNTIYKITTL